MVVFYFKRGNSHTVFLYNYQKSNIFDSNIILMKTFNSFLLLLVFFSGVFMTACKQDEETPVKEPSGAFFRCTMDSKSKSITNGTNGYVMDLYDSCYTDAGFDQTVFGMSMTQANSGYYISSKEAIWFDAVNLVKNDNPARSKDSLYRAILGKASIPVYTSVGTTAAANGFKITWRDANGKMWSSDLGPQTSSFSVDSFRVISAPASLTQVQLYVKFDCKLYAVGESSSKTVSDATARLVFLNSCFY